MTSLLIVGYGLEGLARHKLDQCLQKAGVVPEHCLISDHVVRRASLIVTLGDTASKQALGDDWPLDKVGRSEGSRKIRGYLWDTRDGRVLTTVHPIDCLPKSDPAGVWEAYLKLDLKKAKRELDLNCPPLPKRQVVVISKPWEFQDARNAIRAASRIAIDIENDYHLELSCLGIAVSRDLAFVVPAKTSEQMSFIREICESDKPKILQNGQYDRLFLTFDHQYLLTGERQSEPILVRNQTVDTMLQWHTLYPELAGAEDKSRKKKGGFSRQTQKSLRFLASIFTREPWWKSYDFGTEMDKYILCGKDCCVTLECAETMEELLK